MRIPQEREEEKEARREDERVFAMALNSTKRLMGGKGLEEREAKTEREGKGARSIRRVSATLKSSHYLQ